MDLKFLLELQNEILSKGQNKQVAQDYASIINRIIAEIGQDKFKELVDGKIVEKKNDVKCPYRNELPNPDDKNYKFYFETNYKFASKFKDFFNEILYSQSDVLKKVGDNLKPEELKAITFYENYLKEKENAYQKNKENAIKEKTDKYFFADDLHNEDNLFLNNGIEGIPMRSAKEISDSETGKAKSIGDLIRFYQQEDLPFSQDLNKDFNEAFDRIFNVSKDNPNGDELSRENVDQAVTAIRNLVDNHNSRPWYHKFFGFFGKVGQELATAEALKQKLIDKGLDKDLVDLACKGSSEEIKVTDFVKNLSKEQADLFNARRQENPLDVNNNEINIVPKMTPELYYKTAAQVALNKLLDRFEDNNIVNDKAPTNVYKQDEIIENELQYDEIKVGNEFGLVDDEKVDLDNAFDKVGYYNNRNDMGIDSIDALYDDMLVDERETVIDKYDQILNKKDNFGVPDRYVTEEDYELASYNKTEIENMKSEKARLENEIKEEKQSRKEKGGWSLTVKHNHEYNKKHKDSLLNCDIEAIDMDGLDLQEDFHYGLSQITGENKTTVSKSVENNQGIQLQGKELNND